MIPHTYKTPGLKPYYPIQFRVILRTPPKKSIQSLILMKKLAYNDTKKFMDAPRNKGCNSIWNNFSAFQSACLETLHTYPSILPIFLNSSQSPPFGTIIAHFTTFALISSLVFLTLRKTQKLQGVKSRWCEQCFDNEEFTNSVTVKVTFTRDKRLPLSANWVIPNRKMFMYT